VIDPGKPLQQNLHSAAQGASCKTAGALCEPGKPGTTQSVLHCDREVRMSDHIPVYCFPSLRAGGGARTPDWKSSPCFRAWKAAAGALALAVLLFVISCPLPAQDTRGSIAGTVTDAQGAAVAGAKVAVFEMLPQVAAGSDQTSARLDAALAGGKGYYWRARANDGAVDGPPFCRA